MDVDQPCLFAKVFDREWDKGRPINMQKRQDSRGGLAKEYALYIFIYLSFVFERGEVSMTEGDGVAVR